MSAHGEYQTDRANECCGPVGGARSARNRGAKSVAAGFFNFAGAALSDNRIQIIFR